MTTFEYFSAFSGIGGFELGIGKQGTCTGYSEINEDAIQIYKKHFPKHKNYGDIKKIEPKHLPKFDVFVAGFPCQPFSVAGKRRGFADTRGTLFFDILRIVRAKRPKYTMLENVKGLFSHDKGNTFSTIIVSLQELGYDVEWVLLNSKFDGIPQNRQRVFIVGTLRGKEYRPKILPFRKSDKTTNVKHRSIDNNTLYKIVADRTRNKAGLGRNLETPKDYTNTLTSTPKDNLVIRVDDTKEVRRLTPIEYERLQAFPDNWTSGLSDNKRYMLIGNAVNVSTVKALFSQLEPF